MTTKHSLDIETLFTIDREKLAQMMFTLVSLDADAFTPLEGDMHDLHGDEFIDAAGHLLRGYDDEDLPLGFDLTLDWVRVSYMVFSALESGVTFEMCMREIIRARHTFQREYPDSSNPEHLMDFIDCSLYTVDELLPDEPPIDLNTGWTVADLQRQWIKHALKHGLPPRHKATVEIFLTDLMKRAQSSEGDISMSTQFGPLIMFGKDEAIDDGTYTPQRRQILSDVFDIWANTIDAQVEKTKQAVLDLFNYARQPKRDKVKLKRADEEPSH